LGLSGQQRSKLRLSGLLVQWDQLHPLGLWGLLALWGLSHQRRDQ
jgi:hypothetical protein